MNLHHLVSSFSSLLHLPMHLEAAQHLAFVLLPCSGHPLHFGLCLPRHPQVHYIQVMRVEEYHDEACHEVRRKVFGAPQEVEVAAFGLGSQQVDEMEEEQAEGGQ